MFIMPCEDLPLRVVPVGLKASIFSCFPLRSAHNRLQCPNLQRPGLSCFDYRLLLHKTLFIGFNWILERSDSLFTGN